MLRHCTFFCNFHTYVMVRWGGVWGVVGWDVNVHWHLHTYVMLRHCTFFCNFHTYVLVRWGGVGWDVNVHSTPLHFLLQLPHIRDGTPGWGGVGWDVNVHWHLHTYVMLRHCTFFCNFHTYVMVRWGGVGWGGVGCQRSLALTHIRDALPLHVLLQLPHIRDGTLGWGGVGCGGVWWGGMLTFIGTYTHT